MTSLEAEGGTLFESSRVIGVDRSGERVTVRTAQAEIDTDRVVLASGQPILDRGAFFARLKPQRSYAAALSSSWVPEGMHLSADQQARSLRSVTVAGGEEPADDRRLRARDRPQRPAAPALVAAVLGGRDLPRQRGPPRVVGAGPVAR
ncbi:hypothetical protein G5V59_03515 [Nocardioides sp. W3-2-3]|nr:hypothetical protein [Nocardioides convexus]